MNIWNIETPALIVDKKILLENMKAMDAIISGTNLKLRPHYKSHKCSELAQLQIKNGAKGMTCSKLSEAIDLCDCGIDDILIANQITDVKKIRRLADLAGCCRLTVCVDDKNNIRELSKAAKNSGTTIYCLVEYEIGMKRCGVDTKEEVLELVRVIEESESLVFEGIQAYAGHISHVTDAKERKNLTYTNFDKLSGLLDYLKENNVSVNIVSGGSTGTAELKTKSIYNELQAGSYLFMDYTYSDLNLPFKNSLFVLSTVVSSKDGLTVVDAGVKTCGVDQGMPGICDNTCEEVVASEEHFQLHKLSKALKVGDKIKLIPGHCCSTINLHNKIYLVEDDKVVGRLLVTARGMGK
ncbi:MAG: DSD1 family PLP-dependent enzyme [Clostridia bacterium]|nr:DSD1 family PLP-dependent enzyme [Clostridia bacterium]